MNAITIGALCVASAVLGRLLLTRDQAWSTITVRLPALLLLVVSAALSIVGWALWAVLCFIGGSFYGLSHWWWPQLFQVLEFDGELLRPIVSGKWE